jgi:adenine-specific DNA-methyltransferase
MERDETGALVGMTSKYDGITSDKLIQLLEARDRQKKLGLVWEREDIEADQAVDANFVVCDIENSLCDEPAPWRNLIIEGDNFDALRWLRMGYAQRIKCIYIDPPYNTGNKDWVYNDHYFDPNDRYRHSTWLEFLYRRLTIARDLLADDGVIFVSINDDNRALLDLLMEEVFPGMRIGSFVWRTKDTANDAEHNFSSVHEHVLIYGREKFSFLGYALDDSKYKSSDDPRGRYASTPITQPKTYLERKNGYYPIQDPKTGWWYPCSPDSVWRYASETVGDNKRLRTETIESLIRDDRIIFPAEQFVIYQSRLELQKAIKAGTGPRDGNGRQLLREGLPDLDFWVGKHIALGRPSKKSFWYEKTSKVRPVGSYILGVNEEGDQSLFELVSEKQGKATGEIQEIFRSKVFNYPKPVSLIRSLVNAAIGSDGLVLDFFAGSGTTAQAVMELNAGDGGERRFIMVSATESNVEDPEKNLCRDICAQRVRLLNAAESGKYGDLAAEFAYLRARKIQFEDIDYDVRPSEIWSIIESIHDLPLTPYVAERAWNVHESPLCAVFYVERVDDGLLVMLEELARSRRNVFVYTWTPGQFEPHVGGLDISVLPVRETLIRRFQQ